METQIERRIKMCERADDAEWEEVVALSRLGAAQKAFLKEHPPGLIKALWRHFDSTRDRCGCTTPGHEGRDCVVPLIDRVLIGEEG